MNLSVDDPDRNHRLLHDLDATVGARHHRPRLGYRAGHDTPSLAGRFSQWLEGIAPHYVGAAVSRKSKWGNRASYITK